ncbi:DUF2330 domain-containing protein [Streptomyces endophytica]|uniref:DUF2330 domain-containing protein n=2 Tax=Streptomyces endophytica TaxID=2991496 RepID=A0ABY6PJI5_9ACTN|nr:DUF2330 domain-containing protein [Streptomyces endophytica]UZJ34058.1 DUF2330 domain-containing protein [Streptomyces endophytica]
MAVGRETSVVRWDGKTEQIVMSLQVNGTAPDAAWIMPVPHRATVRLGDPAVFDRLATLTEPAVAQRHYFWPHGGDWPFGHNGTPRRPRHRRRAAQESGSWAASGWARSTSPG